MFKRKKSGTSKGDSKKLWETYLKASLKQEWIKAKDALQGIINLEPDNSKTHLKMGDLLQKLGDSKGAIKAYHNSASILVKSGFNQKALALYKIILRLDPKDKQALSDTKRLAESPKSAASPLPASSPEAPAAPSQPEEPAAAPEEFTVYEDVSAPEGVPAPDDILLSETMPPPADLTSTEETDLGHMPPPVGLPESEDIPSGWPDEEISTEPQEESLSEFEIEPTDPQEEEAIPGFDMEPTEPQSEEAIAGFDMEATEPQSEEAIAGFDMEATEPQGEEAIPGFDMEPTEPQGEEAIPGFNMESSGAESEDPPMELFIKHSEHTPGETLTESSMDSSIASVRELEEWTGTLPEIFWSLNKEELTQIFNDSVIASYTKGQTVVEEGDKGDSIFAIMDGSALVQTSLSGKTVDLAVLKAGDVFGEVAFLTGKPRTATVVANSDMKVIDMSRAALEKAIEKHPRILSCLAEYYYDRLNDTITKVKKAKMPKVRLTVQE